MRPSEVFHIRIATSVTAASAFEKLFVSVLIVLVPLESIDRNDRAALYRALGVSLTYRRVDDVEEVRVRAMLRPADLEQVKHFRSGEDSEVTASMGVDLKRVEGAFATMSTRRSATSRVWLTVWLI